MRRSQRNSWAFGSGEFFFSAPECDNDLGLASPCMPTSAQEVIFSRIIPILLAGVGGGGGGGVGGGVGVGVPPFVRACSLELVGFRGASSEYDS